MITASYLTLAGSTYGQPPRYNMLKRAQAAHDAGIEAIGVRLDEPIAFQALDYVQIPECEWIDLSVPVTRAEINDLRAMAELLGITRLNAGACNPVTVSQAARNLGRLLEVTIPLGITVAVEPVAFGPLKTIAQIAEVMSGLEGCGLLYDFWQISAVNQMLWIPAPPMAEIQACGYWYSESRELFEASQDRPLLGESWSQDTREFVMGKLREIAPDVPLSYENPNARLRGMTLPEMAQAAADDMALLA